MQNVIELGQKVVELRSKNARQMPIYGHKASIRWFFAHYLTKYQYFWIKTSTIQFFHWFTYFLQFRLINIYINIKYALFMAKKLLKCTKWPFTIIDKLKILYSYIFQYFVFKSSGFFTYLLLFFTKVFPGWAKPFFKVEILAKMLKIVGVAFLVKAIDEKSRMCILDFLAINKTL